MLDRFPVEILRQILNGENSWAAIELWKAGNVILNMKLANRGVTDVDLEDLCSSSSSRWPQCLAHFKLERLRISRPRCSLGSPRQVRSYLKQLHSGLRSLEIRAMGLGETFFGVERHQPREPSVDPPPSKRHKAHEDYDGNSNGMEKWDLNLTWPRLERLDLTPDEIVDWSDAKCDSSLSALLPRSLTCLCSPYWVSSSLSSLPPGLRILDLGKSTLTERALHSLPKSITDLKFYQGHTGFSALAAITQNPNILPSLENLHYTGSRFMHDDVKHLLLEQGFNMPPSRCLSIPSEDGVQVKLPGNLLSLRMYSATWRVPHCLSEQEISTLPTRLTSLSVSNLNWREMHVKIWSPSLLDLEVEFSNGFGADCFHLLPRTLRTLKVGSSGSTHSEPMPQRGERTALCNDIAALRALGIESLRLEADVWQKEKARLVQRGAVAFAQEIEAGGLLGLPLGLTKLSVYDTDYAFNTELFVPPRMLAVEWKVKRSKRFWVLSNYPACCLLSPSSALHMPYISSLSMELKEGEIGLLPRSLYHLECDGFNFADHPVMEALDVLKQLPPNLESLICNGMFSNLELRSAWISVLPKRLVSLELGRTPIYGADLIKLPKTLTSLTTQLINTTLSHLRQLPRGIRKLEALEHKSAEIYSDRNGRRTSTSSGEFGNGGESSRAISGAKSAVGADKAADERILDFNTLRALIAACRPFWRIWDDAKLTQLGLYKGELACRPL